jgi:hypothetical protein
MTREILHISKVIPVQVDGITGKTIQIARLSITNDIQLGRNVNIDRAIVSNPRIMALA